MDRKENDKHYNMSQHESDRREGRLVLLVVSRHLVCLVVLCLRCHMKKRVVSVSLSPQPFALYPMGCPSLTVKFSTPPLFPR